MKRTPPISIGLPVYNGEKYLRRSIESLLAQSSGDFELIISDNASTDGTSEICHEYVRKDRRVKYFRQTTNIGAPRNWNFIFSKCQSPYFKWASANDLCHPQMLQLFKSILDQNPDVVLCFCMTKIIDENDRVVGEYSDPLNVSSPHPRNRFVEVLTKIELNNAQNGLLRSDILRKTALEGVYQGGDIPLVAELSLYGKFYKFPDYLFFRRMSPDAVSLYQGHEKSRIFNLGSTPRLAWKFWGPRWHSLLRLFQCVRRAPIASADRRYLYYFLMKTLYWGVHP